MKLQQRALDPVDRRPSASQPLLWLLWIAVLAAMPVWIAFDSSGWDIAIYQSAMHAVKLGHDPYADAVSVQIATHLAGGVAPGADPPFSYVYPPATLPLLRSFAALPETLVIASYWILYALAALAQLWACFQFVQATEHKWFLFLTPLAPFFPGLLANGVILSGNIAYLLYASILLTATLGWRRKGWYWFYAAVLLASCFKAPLLSLVVIAPLSARRQWVPTAITTALGATAFAAQSFLWPDLFRHYLQAVDLQFRYNRDFGCSPAGLISDLLYRHNVPYSPTAFIIYLCYAIPTFTLLLSLSRRYLQGFFSAQEWLPVLLVGVILLNPRLIEYDVAPLVIPLALIAGRAFLQRATRIGIAWLVAAFLALNAIALASWSFRKVLDGFLIVALFLLGAWRLSRLAPSGPSSDRALIPLPSEQSSMACSV